MTFGQQFTVPLPFFICIWINQSALFAWRKGIHPQLWQILHMWCSCLISPKGFTTITNYSFLSTTTTTTTTTATTILSVYNCAFPDSSFSKTASNGFLCKWTLWHYCCLLDVNVASLSEQSSCTAFASSPYNAWPIGHRTDICARIYPTLTFCKFPTPSQNCIFTVFVCQTSVNRPGSFIVTEAVQNILIILEAKQLTWLENVLDTRMCGIH